VAQPEAPVEVEVVLEPQEGAVGGPDVAETSAPPPPEPRAGTTGWASWTALGAGTALLAGGAVLGVLSRQAEQDRDDLVARSRDDLISHDDFVRADDDARSRALLANVLYGVGGAAVLTGVVLRFVDDDAPAGAGLHVVPVPGGATLTWRGGL